MSERPAWVRLSAAKVVVVIIVMLFGGATASAECAWVIWERADDSRMASTQTEAVGAHPTKQDCERGITTILARFKPDETAVVRKEPIRGEVYVTYTSENGWEQANPLRLPPRHRGPARADGRVSVKRAAWC